MGLGNDPRAEHHQRSRCVDFGSLTSVVLALLLVLLVGQVLDPLPAGAAEIRIDPSLAAGQGAVLEGKLEAGDFDKVRNFILDGAGAHEIYLASPGGNLAEAMKIGLLVRLLKLSTVVPSRAPTPEGRETLAARHGLTNPRSDYMCASACFFVFVGGLYRESDAHGEPILGVHRPAVVQKGPTRLSPEQLAGADAKAQSVIKNYVKAMEIPTLYADEMYSVPKNYMRWIRNDEFERDFKGFVPELRDVVRAFCTKPTGTEIGIANDNELINRDDKEAKCEQKFQDELAVNARNAALNMRAARNFNLEPNMASPSPTK
jgi:hypothetical protein